MLLNSSTHYLKIFHFRMSSLKQSGLLIIIKPQLSSKVSMFCMIHGKWVSLVAKSEKSACNARDLGLILGLGRSPGEGNGRPTPVFLPGEFHGQRSLVCYSPRGRKELDTTEQLTLKLSKIWLGFPGGSVVKNLPANAGNAGSIPGSGRSPEEGNGPPTPVFLPRKCPGQRSLAGYGCKWVGHDLETKQQRILPYGLPRRR